MTDTEKLTELLKNSPYLDVLGGLDFYERAADHLISNSVTFQKWIPVTERLPDMHGTFIVALYIRSRKRKYSDSATFDPVTKRWRTHLFWGKCMKVTHWMPLPEPPKEDA